MNNIDKSTDKKSKKSCPKNKWREIEVLMDRYQLMKELREDDCSCELEVDDLSIY